MLEETETILEQKMLQELQQAQDIEDYYRNMQNIATEE